MRSVETQAVTIMRHYSLVLFQSKDIQNKVVVSSDIYAL